MTTLPCRAIPVVVNTPLADIDGGPELVGDGFAVKAEVVHRACAGAAKGLERDAFYPGLSSVGSQAERRGYIFARREDCPIRTRR